MDFCRFQEICLTNMGKKLVDTTTKTSLDAANTASKKIIHEAVEATGELINKMADKKKRKSRNTKRLKRL